MISDEGLLVQSVLTDADFEQMSWHDCTIYAYFTDYAVVDLVLDIDYICKWAQPFSGQPLSCYVAPATLAFHSAREIRLDALSAANPLSIADVHREDGGTIRTVYGSSLTDQRWVIEGFHGTLTLHAVGYTVYLRQQPILVEGQRLALDQRGGISFRREAIGR